MDIKHRCSQIFIEEMVMVYAISKWLLLSIITGLLVGIGVSIFIKLLTWSIQGTELLPAFFQRALLPLGIIASAMMVKYLAPEAEGHGTEKVVQAVHERAGQIDIKVVPVKMFSTIVTVAAGGSVGKEGPATQIAAGITSTIAQWLNFNDIDKKKLVICGVSAGFAAVFGTPVAGAVFALEVLYIGQIFYDVLFPSFISGVVAWRVANFIGLFYSVFPIAEHVPVFSVSTFSWTVLAGIFFGLVSFIFIECMTLCEKCFKSKYLNPFVEMRNNLLLKAIVGSSLILLVAWFAGPDYFGLSDLQMSGILHGKSVPMWGFFWKIIFTCLTLSCGGSGGVVTPIFYIGAASGAAFASYFGLNPVTYASWGLIGVLAGSANAPISSTIMAVELFGGEAAPFAAIVSVTSFMLVGNRSIYPTQLLSRSKSSLLEVDGKTRVEFDHWVPRFERSPMMYNIFSRTVDDQLRHEQKIHKEEESAEKYDTSNKE